MKPIRVVAFVSLLLSACSRPVSDSANLVVDLSGPSRFSTLPFKAQLQGMTSFGRMPIETEEEIDCIGLFVKATGGTPETCYVDNGDELPLTHSTGFVARSSTLTLDVPAGPDREISVLGVRSLNGTCPKFEATDRILISQPVVIASVTKTLTAGENVVSVTADAGGPVVQFCEKQFHKSAACDLVSERDPAQIHNDRILVHLASPATFTDFDIEFARLGMVYQDEWFPLASLYYSLPAGLTPQAAAAQICESPMVQFVEPLDLSFTPIVFNSMSDWSMGANPKSVVAILSTGLDHSHSVLTNFTDSFWENPFGEAGADEDTNGVVDLLGYNFVNGNPDLSDGDGQGTQLAGAVLQQSIDITATGGVSSITVLPVKVINDSGLTEPTRIAAGVLYATDANADVILFGSGDPYGSELVRRAMIYANNRGAMLVAPTGNGSTDSDLTPSFPSAYDIPNVVSVAAHTSTLNKATFSDFGALTVDIAGSGVSIFTTQAGGSFGYSSGTTMAGAAVAGAAAVAKNSASQISGYQLRTGLLDSSYYVPAWFGLSQTEGVLDAPALLSEITNVFGGAPYDQPVQ